MATTPTREVHEASRREGRDSHGRRPYPSSRSRRNDHSPRRGRDDRRHESDRSRRSHYGSRTEQSAKEDDHGDRRNRHAKEDDQDERRNRHAKEDDRDERKSKHAKEDDHDERRNRHAKEDDHDESRSSQDAAQHDDHPPVEGKSLGDAKNDPPVRHERSPRGIKRFSESREAWRPRSFSQHDERGSAGQGGRHSNHQASDYGRQRGQKEHNNDDSTWKHDGFFQLAEEAPLAKRRPAFKEMRMPLEEQESLASVGELDSKSRKTDQPGPTTAMGEDRRNYHTRGFIRPDDRGTRRGFSDNWGAGLRNGYDSRGRFAGRGGRGRDRFNGPYGGRSMYQAAGDEAEKWKHDLYDQTNRSPTPKTEEEQIAKVEALLAL